jgi:hypothetical protein
MRSRSRVVQIDHRGRSGRQERAHSRPRQLCLWYQGVSEAEHARRQPRFGVLEGSLALANDALIEREPTKQS